jgi:hypothetical protein
MASKQKTLAYTIQGGGASNLTPQINIGYPVGGATLTPRNTRGALLDEFYWVCILMPYTPWIILTDFVIPGSNNSTVPAGVEAAMSEPGNIFVVATRQLSIQHVPTGDWLNYLLKYGAARELQRINQLSTTTTPGLFKNAGYVLASTTGPRGESNIPPPSYEASTLTDPVTIVAMSIKSYSEDGPYSLIDSYKTDVRMKSSRATARTKGKTTRPKSKGKASKTARSKSKR